MTGKGERKGKTCSKVPAGTIEPRLLPKTHVETLSNHFPFSRISESVQVLLRKFNLVILADFYDITPLYVNGAFMTEIKLSYTVHADFFSKSEGFFLTQTKI